MKYLLLLAVCFFSTVHADEKVLWIGCSSIKEKAEKSVGASSNVLTVHANLANLVSENDPEVIEAMNKAIQDDNVTKIVIAGVYGCPGVAASLDNNSENCLKAVHALYLENKEMLDKLPTKEDKVNRLVELNVIEQVKNVTKSKPVQNAWNNKKQLQIVGIVFDRENDTVKEIVRS